ncbi:P pilus assembly/Cpx signaling pathway, periplasmic inhibitor/zinc-resistance associated protein (modular protein) [Hyella patelloides LEGE 07179]|uniref:P pilus assembly/Cpx signaling pathway, periplasmic inhibitor/zinc-resistance associated protein (Modular protein) n=1 Tax=Hyella patelloides LEGE 07179 TaxID=945734 RepID=A0A563VV30_9CYAN|nr:Spy/CpxP family protein refolding chaperone [Hyella patelloides]VEP15131.1 P pilus assembly/Cpx signaling pathway, periplasmic inhibitor/zinc-resistance associated protein (modular protein) [Hyella patelloides LEGE 07179]
MQRCYSQLLLSFTVVICQPYQAIANTPRHYYLVKKHSYSQIIIADNFQQTTEKKTPSSLFEQLNLTPQQRSQIRQIRRRYQAQITRLKEELRISQQQLSIMMAGTDSATNIRVKHEEIVQFRQQLGKLHFESMLATREILTPQQRQKFAEIIEAKQ